MEPQLRSAITVRTKRLGLALAVLALASGCSHRRTALRPVYMSPAPVVAPAAPCGPGAAPCATGDATPVFGDPSELTTSPPAGPSGAVRPKTDDVTPQSGEEPKLFPNDKPTSENAPPLNAPNARRETNRRPALGTGAREEGVKERVSGFIQEPDDLFLPPKADRAWKYIVLHHSDHATGSYAQIDRDHRDRLGTQGCGYHFVIGNGTESPDGRVEVASRWLNQKAGAHCRDASTTDANDYGIGICLIGDFSKNPPSAKQIEASRALVDYLRNRYDIPADHIVTHSAIAKTSTSCPGSLFPVAEVVNGENFASR